jgi:hypothetical protein
MRLEQGANFCHKKMLVSSSDCLHASKLLLPLSVVYHFMAGAGSCADSEQIDLPLK